MRATTSASSTISDQRRVSIVGADPTTGEVMVRDTNGAEFSLLGTTRVKGSGFPAPGEIWLVQRFGPTWILRTQIGAAAPPVVTGAIPADSALAKTVEGLAALGIVIDESTEGSSGGGTDEATVNALIAAALKAAPDPVDADDVATKGYVDTSMAGIGDGLSAYEIAVNNGFSGTEAEWLASLEGPAGADGPSAYDIAVDNGFSGSQTVWLASLHGADGADGDSAYQVAVTSGFVGTEAEWLASLQGADGADGADSTVPGPPGPANTLTIGTVTTGSAGAPATADITGTSPDQTLNLTIPKGDPGSAGSDGSDGLSAYEVAVGNGFVGTQAEWLTSLQGTDGDPGDPGTPGADGRTVLYGSGAPGAGTGADDDFYIDMTAHAIYGPKASGAWPAGTSLIGPAGADGTIVAVSTTPPPTPSLNDLWVDLGSTP